MTPAAELKARQALEAFRRAVHHLHLAAESLSPIVGAADDHARAMKLLDHALTERDHLARRIEDDEPWRLHIEDAP